MALARFRTFDPAAIAQPRLRELYAYWHARCRGHTPPPRDALDPVDIPHLLANLMLIDVQHAPFDLRYRLVGTALVEHIGRDTTGMRVEDGYLGDDWPRILSDYEAAVFEARPVFTRNDIVGHDDRRYIYERLLLPLSSDGESVDMLIGAAVFERL
jgi:hypothetical protein